MGVSCLVCSVCVLPVQYEFAPVLLWEVGVGLSRMMTVHIDTTGIVRMALRPGLCFSYMVGA